MVDLDFATRRGGFARLLQGSARLDTRRLLQAAFNRSFPRVLVAQSIVGREGLNLHEACRVVPLLGRVGAEFTLKGGVLVAQLIRAPHRFTRDSDVLRRQGPPAPDEIRERFRAIVSVPLKDGSHSTPRASGRSSRSTTRTATTG